MAISTPDHLPQSGTGCDVSTGSTPVPHGHLSAAPASVEETGVLVDGADTAVPDTLTDAERQRNAETRANASSASTRANYASQLAIFMDWCNARGLSALAAAPETVETYLNDRADGCIIPRPVKERRQLRLVQLKPAKPPTLRLARAAIAKAHRLANLPDPTQGSPNVAEALKGLTRRYAVAGGRARQATALTAENLAAIRAVATTPRRGRFGRDETPAEALRRGQTDIALCSLMRDGLLRRSEAAALTWTDVEAWPDGTGRIYLGVSKGDQEGDGTTLFLSRGTMRALRAIHHGAPEGARVFDLCPHQIGRRIQAACREAGLYGHYSGHSPRVGMARDLARIGAELPALMTAGRWKSSAMPARYTAAEQAGRGAVARYYEDQEG